MALSLTSRADTLLVALGSKLILWKPTTDQRDDYLFALPGSPRVRFNDGRADPLGNFWIGSMKNNVEPDGESGDVADGEGILFRIDPAGTITEWKTTLGISNTLCWSPDQRHFYFADTLHNIIWRYDFDKANAAISNETVFFRDFDRGLPDGSAIDARGFLWNCRYDGGCIVRLAPDGTIDRVIDMPAQNVTTATFGGPDLKTLYVTTALGTRRGDRLAGSLFSMHSAVPGLPENVVRLA